MNDAHNFYYLTFDYQTVTTIKIALQTTKLFYCNHHIHTQYLQTYKYIAMRVGTTFMTLTQFFASYNSSLLKQIRFEAVKFLIITIIIKKKPAATPAKFSTDCDREIFR